MRREQALLAEIELRVSHVLSDAARQVELTHQLMETNYNRFAADMVQADVLEKRKNAFPGGLFIALQAQRQVVNSAGEFYRSLSEYNLAIRDFHREKGSLLAYNQVLLAEGPWAAGSAQDAYAVGRFLTPRIHPEKVCAPRPITSGVFNPSEVQNTTPRDPSESAPSGSELMPTLSEAASGEFQWPGSETLTGADATPATGTPTALSPASGTPSYLTPVSGRTRLDDSQPVNVAPVPANYSDEE
jgi:hypothetical protein